MPAEDQYSRAYPATPAAKPITPEEEAELHALMQMEQGGGGTLSAGQPWNVDEPLKAKPTSQPRLDYTPAEPAPQSQKPPSAVPHDLDWKAAAPDPERNGLVVADRETNMNDPEAAFEELGKNMNEDSLNEWKKAVIKEGAAKLSGIPPAFMGPAEPDQKQVSEGDMQAHLADILNHAEISDFDRGGKYYDQRYVETTHGTVDLKHVVAAGSLPMPLQTIGPVTHVWEEGQKWLGYPQSAYADEDLRSNFIGANAKDTASATGKTFGEQGARRIGNLGVSFLPYAR